MGLPTVQRRGPHVPNMRLSKPRPYGFEGMLVEAPEPCRIRLQLDIAGDEVHALVDTGAAKTQQDIHTDMH